MIDLAVANAIARELFPSEMGVKVHWGVSPIMGSGLVSDTFGVWVNSTGVRSDKGTVTAQIQVSTRLSSPEEQAGALVALRDWVRDELPRCQLTATLRMPGETNRTTYLIDVVSVGSAAAESLDAVDGSGRWIKSMAFELQFKQRIKKEV